MDDADGAEQPGPITAGDALRAAREARGLTLDQIAERTRVARRQLEAIETGSYGSLPSPTYAVGFAKAYARAVGADEVAIAAQVRDEVARQGRTTPVYQPYEAPDPSRVPSRALAIVAAGIALAILILVGLYFGTDLFRGGARPTADTVDTGVNTAPAATGVTAVVPPPAQARPSGQVRLAATTHDVWLRVYDADNKTLYLGTLKAGDHFDVPAGANHPMVNVGRADELAVTLDGRAAPALGTGEHAIKDVPVDGAAIAARIAAAPATASTPTPTPTPSSSPSASSGTPARSSSHRGGDRSRSRSGDRPRPRATDETARANLDSAATPPPAGNSQ